MDEKQVAKRTSSGGKAEDNRWASDPGTVERRDRDRADPVAEGEIVNRTGKGHSTPRRYDEVAETPEER